MNKRIKLLSLTAMLIVGLTTPRFAQQAAPDDEIANASVHPSLAAINDYLLTSGVRDAQVTSVALMVDRNYPADHPILYVADRTLRLNSQFVANDPRRRSDVGLDWTFDTRRSTPRTLVNGVPGILASADTVQQTRLSVERWVELPCYSAEFGELPYPLAPGYENIEFVDDFYLGGETQPFRPVAEITVGGYLPASFFRQIFAHGDNILGVAYQFTFIDPITRQPTDIDHNGKLDTFWTEIYFNDLHYWGDVTAPGIDPNQVIDLQTVALHEAGHAFGLNHFGRTFANRAGIMFAGYNIMSQVYTPNRSLFGTPTGTFCGIYASWQ